MPQVKLIGGFYEAQSLIADAQRCLNLYPEQNPEDAPFPFTHYLTPGLRRIGNEVNGPGQGMYVATNGDLYMAAGGGLFYVDSNFQYHELIRVAAAPNRVYMSDNSTAGTMLVVDGSARGVQVDLASRVASVVATPGFYGGTRVDFLDGYFILNVPGQNEFYISNQYDLTFNPLYFAGKTGGGDPLIAAVALHREIWLIGTKTTEVWYNTGSTDFPYQAIQGVFIQHGCVSVDSIATQDLSIYWLSMNPQGQGIVLRGNGYAARRISTHAIEKEFQSYSRIDDAIGFTYQQNGHIFYYLLFPTANKSWVFDEATQLWHERCSIDNNGNETAAPACSVVFAYGQTVVQDRIDGSLYAYDLSYGKDDTNYNSGAIKRLRTFPHMINDGKRLEYTRFIADMKTGNANNIPNIPGALGDDINGQPLLDMRFSDDRGGSWSTPSQQTFGATGQDATQIIWPRLGTSKDRIFELSWTTSNITALNGGFVEIRQAIS